MKQSISFSISPIANGLIFSAFSDYGTQSQIYFASLAELLDQLPADLGEAIANQERCEAEQEAHAKNSVYAQQRMGYPGMGKSLVQTLAQEQEEVNTKVDTLLRDVSTMKVGAPQIFDDAGKITEDKGARPVFRRPGPPAD